LHFCDSGFGNIAGDLSPCDREAIRIRVPLPHLPGAGLANFLRHGTMRCLDNAAGWPGAITDHSDAEGFYRPFDITYGKVTHKIGASPSSTHFERAALKSLIDGFQAERDVRETALETCQVSHCRL
jgi:hypothetical protein